MKTAFILACVLAAATASDAVHKFKDVVRKVKKGSEIAEHRMFNLVNKAMAEYKDFRGRNREADDKWAALDIEVDGETKQVYIAAPFWFTGTPDGKKIEIPYGGRLYLSNSYSVDPEQYFRPNFLGATVEYDVDLSQLTCGCVAALYLVSMPGKKQDGTFDPSGDKLYYCDAN